LFEKGTCSPDVRWEDFQQKFMEKVFEKRWVVVSKKKPTTDAFFLNEIKKS